MAIHPDLAGTRQENDLPGCISWPFRLIALVIVVPVRLLWEALAVIGRLLRRYLLAPLGRVITVLILRPGAWLITTLVVVPLRWLVVTFMIVPGAWIYRRVVAPAGRWLWRWVLRPICVAAGLLILTPVAWMAELTAAVLELLYRLIRPGLAAFGEALLWTWRMAGLVLFHALIRPVRWFWRTFVRPIVQAWKSIWRPVGRELRRWF